MDNRVYKGAVIKSLFPININLSVYDLHSFESIFLNESININGLNFSSKTFANYYFNNFLSIELGRLPLNTSEAIMSIHYKEIYNISLNSKINFQYYNDINTNLTIVGFYHKQKLSLISSDNAIILLLNNYGNEIFQIFKNEDYDIKCYFFLNHFQMDVFNINGFETTISNIQHLIGNFFANVASDYIIFSSLSCLQSGEFIHYINLILVDLFSLLIPIFILIVTFTKLFSNYFTRIELKYWNKINYFLSKKKIKKKIIFELFIDNLISYFIALPIGISLFLFFNFNSPFKPSDFILFIPNSYFFFTFTLLIFIYLIMCYFIIRSYNKYRSKDEKGILFSVPDLFERRKIFNFILAIFTIFPIITIILYFLQISFSNVIIGFFNTVLWVVNSGISLLYSIIVVLTIIITTHYKIIKLVKLISRYPFRKLKNIKSKLISEFFEFKKLNFLIFLVFLSLGLGFINFYHLNISNKDKQEKFEIYLAIGSDIIISEPYTVNDQINLTNYLEDEQFCSIKIIPGTISNNFILQEYCILSNFDPMKYLSVLNENSQSAINYEFLDLIKNLGSYEIIIPFYLKLRYNLNVGDLLFFQPQNASQYDGGLFNLAEKQLLIKGFYNFLPGLDNDATYYDTIYSENNLIVITSFYFNMTHEFIDLPIGQTSLARNFNNTYQIVENMVHNNVELRYLFLTTELNKSNVTYFTINSGSLTIMFWLFITVFILMNLLIINNFLIENKEFWYLFQLFNLSEKDLKKFVCWGLIGIFMLIFLIGWISGILSSIIIFYSANLTFKHFYYIYPLHFILDQSSILFNLIYITSAIFIIWIFTHKLTTLKFNYEKLRKYSAE